MMANTVSAEHVEQLAAQLSLQEQLRIVASISQRLSELIKSETVDERQRREYAQQVDAFLKMSDELAADTIGEVDSVEDIRQLREERMAQL
jgi:hypothetical protein